MTTTISIDHLIIEQYKDEAEEIHFRIGRFNEKGSPLLGFDFKYGDEVSVCKFYSELSKLLGIAKVLPDDKTQEEKPK